MESNIFIIIKFIFSYEKNIKVISLILSLLLFSCNDSPVSPEMEYVSSGNESNLFRNSDFILNENLILNENQIAELKIDETIFQKSLNGNELFKLKYSPNTSGEFFLNFNSDILISEIRDSKNNLIKNESHTGNPVYLNSDEVYSLSISKSKISQSGESKLKTGDIIYFNTQRREGTPIASIIVSQNSCDECRITNTTFSQNYSNMTFLFSEFINCKFENIQMDGNKFTGTFFQNCDFYFAIVTDNNFEKTNIIASNFSGDTEFKDCNFDNANFSSNTISSAGFFSSSFVRARMRLTSFDATLFQNCDMQFITIYSPLNSIQANDLYLFNSNLSNGTILNYDLQYSNLSKSNFTNASIMSCNLNSVNLSGTVLFNTNFSSSYLCGVIGTPAVIRSLIQIGTACPIRE